MKSSVYSIIIYCLLLLNTELFGAVVTRGPFLQAAGHDRMTVCWRTDVATTTEVRYSTSLEGPMLSEQVSGTRTDHVVNLVGLQSSYRYFYSIHGVPTSGTAIQVGGVDHWFRTAPENLDSEVARFWVVGDAGYQFVGPVTNFNAFMAKTVSTGKTTHGFLMLGDNAYDIGTDSQIQTAVFNRYATLLRNTPLWSAFGNHDGYSVPFPFTAVTPYDTGFYFPTSGQSGGIPSGSVRFYSFDHGDIHFISLDTFTPINSRDALGGEVGMVDWLKDDLEQCQKLWIVAFMHYGPYSKGSHNSDTEGAHVRQHIIPLLEEYGVDLVLCGHSHVYERSRLIDGHYGTSSTWNQSSMLKQNGNGSDLGGVSSSGGFVLGAGTGSYFKSAALARSGAVYAVIGASSASHGWYGGSTQLVAPNPHPVHSTNLNLMGSMVLEVKGNRLNGQYMDNAGATRDDFSLIKGATYTAQLADPSFETPNSPGAAFTITRSGNLAAESISISFIDANGDSIPPGNLNVPFALNQVFETVTFGAPVGSGVGNRYRMKINPMSRAVQTGAAQRQIYHIEGGESSVEFGSTPASTWFATFFSGQVPTPSDWNEDHDGDGASTLLEYGLGSDPTKVDSLPLFDGSTDNGKLVFRYVRPLGRSDLNYRIEQSYGLDSWQPLVGGDVNDGALTAEGEPRRAEVVLDGTTRFLRLAVTLSP